MGEPGERGHVLLEHRDPIRFAFDEHESVATFADEKRERPDPDPLGLLGVALAGDPAKRRIVHVLTPCRAELARLHRNVYATSNTRVGVK